MRYMTIDTVTFTDRNGRSYAVKDFREIPAYTIRKTVDYMAKDTLDEYASRDECYKEYGEDQAYKLFEANMTEIVDAGYDMTKIKRLKVPV